LKSIFQLFILTSLVFAMLASGASWGQLATPSFNNQQGDQQEKLSDLTAACVRAPKKDKICDAIIEFQQLGYDSVEIIKEYVPLGPFEYATLTAINYGMTGRIRVRSRAPWSDQWRHIYDYQKDKSMFFIERNF
jgi:hypothetical protein